MADPHEAPTKLRALSPVPEDPKRDVQLMALDRPDPLEPQTFGALQEIAAYLAKSTLVPESCQSNPANVVMMIIHGRSLGMTMQLPTDDRHNFSKEFLYNTLAILLGGRVAEELVLNHIPTGAGNDLERATDLARKMVCEWGMSEKLGPLTFGKKNEEIFLGREIATHRDFSEQVAIEIGLSVGAVRKRLDKLRRHARFLRLQISEEETYA